MNKEIIYTFLALLVLFFSSSLYCQSENNNKTDKDSINTDSIFQIKFHREAQNFSPLLLLGKNYMDDQYMEFYFPEFQIQYEYNSINTIPLEVIRAEMSRSFQIYRQGQIKTDLGVVGQILGYTQAAAVVGLAIYHIHKYGFK